MINIITAEALELKIRELAAALPDFVYESYPDGVCKYTTGKNGEGCLIGQALVALEPDLILVLTDIDSRYCMGIDVLPRHLPIELTISPWIIDIQKQQDKGFKWSKCVEIADRLMES
jgi:hypothetical protein